MDLHCDLDTIVLLTLNLIGWGLFLVVWWRDHHPRLHHSS